MKREEKERVHKIVWDWCSLRFREYPEDRQDMVRTLHRLVGTCDDLRSLLSLYKVDASFRVFSTILWAFYRHTLSHGLPETALPLLQDILQHRSLSRRLLCCDMLRKLCRRGLVPQRAVDQLEGPIRSILRRHPRHERAVFVVTRYVMDVPSSFPITPATLLPCGGIAWAKAIEYVLSLDETTTLSARLLAPLPSSHDTDDLVRRWSVDVQRSYVRAAVNSNFVKLVGGRLLAIMEALSYLTKVPGDMGPVVPGVLTVLESLHAPFVTINQRYNLWESAWRILARHPLPGGVAVRVWKILATFPDLSASWCKDQIRTVLAGLGTVPEEFIVSLLRVLPCHQTTAQSPAIVRLLAGKCCTLINAQGQRFCWDVGCVDVCCVMDPETHADFVQDHTQVYTEALVHVEARVRIRARQMLPKVPDALFEAAIPLLETRIADGDVSCMIAIQNLSAPRKRRFALVLQDLVLARADIYADDDGRPSIALVTFAGLPPDILRPLARSVVQRIADTDGGSTLSTIWDARIRDRLFLLSQMPAGILDLDDVLLLGDQYWEGHTLAFALRMVYNTKSAAVYDHFKYRCFGVVAWGDDRLKHLALYVLQKLPSSVLDTLLATLDLTRLSPTYACKLLELTSPAFLNQKSDFIVQLCVDNPLECCLDLLALVPSLDQHASQILALTAKYEQQGQDGRWHSLRVVLTKIGLRDRVDEMLFMKAFR